MDVAWQQQHRPPTSERDFDNPPRQDRTPPSGVPRTSGDVGGSIPDQLVALDRLRRQGILSEQEFANKKAELLGRI
jgi:hypothetical protein